MQVVDFVEDEAGEAAVEGVLGSLAVEGSELHADGEGAGDGDADVEEAEASLVFFVLVLA
jgi:hypothetical protein